MIFFLLLEQYWNRQPDERFQRFWESRVLGRLGRHLFWMPLHVFLGSFLIAQVVLFGTDSFLLELLVYGVILVLYGGVYVRTVIHFFAVGNRRYLASQFDAQPPSFDKSNVVYEKKKR